MEGTSATDSSPQRSPRRVSKSLGYAHHTVQCSCDAEHLSFFARRYHSFVGKPNLQSCWRVQLWLRSSSPPQNPQEAFHDLLSSTVETPQYFQSLTQIDLDLARTYPDELYFNRHAGQAALRRCLLAFSKYDLELGYVQGMNFIMASLLWHATEVDAFWLFVRLIEDYELRDTYLPKLPGLAKHCQIIHLLILEFLPQLHYQFAEHRINCEMYATEWCFTLFASVIPPTQMHHVLDCFFERGWVYFYRLVIVLLECLQDRILKASDPIEVLLSLKICHRSQQEWEGFLHALGRRRVTWEVLNPRALALEVDEGYIRQLHLCFNVDTAQFNLKTASNA